MTLGHWVAEGVKDTSALQHDVLLLKNKYKYVTIYKHHVLSVVIY